MTAQIPCSHERSNRFDKHSQKRQLAKRGIDILFASVGILLLLPLWVFFAFLIIVDSPGGVLFCQCRYGLHGRKIVVYKFRTMYKSSSDAVFRQATRDDSRVTRVGQLLRRSSLDELPQLLNVLEGSMSLVGPRPHPVDLDDKYVDRIENINERYRVKPGITGWAQIKGHRGETSSLESMCRRLRCDRAYVRHCSVMLDLKILFSTVPSLFTHEAY